MPTPRPPTRRLALALAAGLSLGAGSDAGAEPQRPAGDPREEVVIPFAHAVGERWRLSFELEERRGEEAPVVVRLDAEVLVLSPLGRDLLVDLTWTHRTQGRETLALWPRREESAATLDQRGGGRLVLRVDAGGSALAVANREEALLALERAAGRALPPAEAEQRLAGLLEEWNVAYGVCGVPLVPGAARVTALAAHGEPVVGTDERVLVAEGPEPARPSAWSVRSFTAVPGSDPREPALKISASTRFDLSSRRLSGWQLTVRREASRRDVRRIAFAEHPAPEPGPVAAVALAR
jgi:hypothetical protein